MGLWVNQLADGLIFSRSIPTEKTADLGSKDRLVRQTGKKRLNRIQDDPLGADSLDRMGQANEEPLKIVLTILFDFAALQSHEINHQLVLRNQCVGIESQGFNIFADIVRGFLKCHEDTGLAVLQGASDQELKSKERLSAAGRTAHQRRSAGG